MSGLHSVTDPVRFIPSTLHGEALAEIIPDALYLVTDANAVRAEPFIRFSKGKRPRLLLLLKIGAAEFVLTEETAVAVGRALTAVPTRSSAREDTMRAVTAGRILEALWSGGCTMAFLLRAAH